MSPLPQNPVVFVPLTHDQITKMLSEKRPLPGYHALLCAAAAPHASKDESKVNLTSQVTFRMLADPNDSNSAEGPAIKHWQVWPIANPDVEGHEAPNMGKRAAEFLHAFFPDDVPEFPRRVDGKMTFKGEPIEASEEAACSIEALNLACQKAVEVFNDHSLIVGRVIFGKVEIEPGKGEYGPSARIKSFHDQPYRELSAERVEEVAPALPEAPAPKAAPAKKGGRK